MSKKIKAKDIIESVVITLIFFGALFLFPILFVAFIKYVEWVTNLLGM